MFSLHRFENECPGDVQFRVAEKDRSGIVDKIEFQADSVSKNVRDARCRSRESRPSKNGLTAN